jgi:phosphatidylglycerophosphatase C
MNIALFDFDGTITKADTLLKFIRFAVGDFSFLAGLIILSPILIAFKLKIISNFKAKQIMLSWFFKGFREEDFKNLAFHYSISQIDYIVRLGALERLYWHAEQGHKIVIVSASVENWLAPWCKKNGFELLATQLEFKNGVVTGNLLSRNCFGIEKVNRIKERYDLSKFEYVYAYGDSKGDIQMLELANESFYKPFKK